MNSIYIIFIASNYRMGKAIRAATGARYNHVALSFSPRPECMYSFSRKHLSTPFVGGFVCERVTRYTFGGQDTDVRMCRVELDEEMYNRARNIIADFSARQEKLKYNYLSAGAYLAGRRCDVRDCYTCIDFVRHVLGIDKFVTFEELECRFASGEVYCGPISGVAVPPLGDEPDDYFRRPGHFWALLHGTGDRMVMLWRFVTGPFVKSKK